jgi:hypothetical protein
MLARGMMSDPGWNAMTRQLAAELLVAMGEGKPIEPESTGGDPRYQLPDDDVDAIRDLEKGLGHLAKPPWQRWLERILARLGLRPPDIRLWWPTFVKDALLALREASHDSTAKVPDDPPDGFPTIPGYRATVKGFDGGNEHRSLWHAVPSTADDIVAIVNWASEQEPRARVRPKGATHSWAPMTPSAAEVVLLDMRRFDRIDEAQWDDELGRVTCGPAVTIEQLSEFLRGKQRMIAFTPAIGFATVGGTMATGGHGKGTDILPEGGATIGSQVVALEMIAYDEGQKRYAVIRVASEDPRLPALRVHLGSAIITSVTLRTVPHRKYSLTKAYYGLRRYLSDRTDETTLLGELGRSMATELMWFPYQGWLGFRRHLLRRGLEAVDTGQAVPLEGTQAYRAFFNFAARDADQAFERALAKSKPRGIGIRFQHALGFGRRNAKLVDAHAGRVYVSHFILRLHAAGWCVVVERSRVAALVRRFADVVRSQQQVHRFPIDGPIEVRITDVEAHEDGPGFSPAAAPRDVPVARLHAVWLNVLTHLGTDAGKLLHDVESFLRGLGPHDGVHRVCGEWHKGWAYDGNGQPWSDVDCIASFRRSFECTSQSWSATQRVLTELDPHELFRSELADILFDR